MREWSHFSAQNRALYQQHNSWYCCWSSFCRVRSAAAVEPWCLAEHILTRPPFHCLPGLPWACVVPPPPKKRKKKYSEQLKSCLKDWALLYWQGLLFWFYTVLTSIYCTPWKEKKDKFSETEVVALFLLSFSHNSLKMFKNQVIYSSSLKSNRSIKPSIVPHYSVTPFCFSHPQRQLWKLLKLIPLIFTACGRGC